MPAPQTPLQATISVGGRFHAFDLARELNRRKMLAHLITSYPAFKVDEWEIPRARVETVTSHEIGVRLLNFTNPTDRTKMAIAHRLHVRFDKIVAQTLREGPHIFVAWSSMALASIRKARAFGARTIVERGSAHIRAQQQILADEYARLHLAWTGIDQRIVEREEIEYGEADYISVPSRFAASTFITNGLPLAKIIVTPYGCDLRAFKPGHKHDDVFRVIACGRLSIPKGTHLLLRAFAELRLRKAELWLIGPAVDEIKPFIAKYQSSNLILKGTIPQSQLAQHYAQGSVFCSASLHEGLSMVIPQALCCGLPVIATTSSGADDLAGAAKSTLLIPPGNLSALKQALQNLYENTALRSAMAEHLRAIDPLRFSWQQYGDSIAKHYNAIAA